MAVIDMEELIPENYLMKLTRRKRRGIGLQRSNSLQGFLKLVRPKGRGIRPIKNY